MRAFIRRFAWVLLALLAWPGTVVAQSSEDTATAFKLFQEGKTHMDDGDCETAVGKFEASLKLHPKVATRMNLAICYQRLGKIASAWFLYREAGGLARKRGKNAIARNAEAAARALEPRLPELMILVPDEVPAVRVMRNDKNVDPKLFGTSMYVDPGAQEITARADGYRSYTKTVRIREGDEITVEIPVLKAQPERPGSSVGPAAAPNPGRSRRMLGVTGMAAGGVGVLAGLGFGLGARSARNDAFASGGCDRDTLLCTRDGQSRMDTAHRRARYANIATGVGVVLAGAGVALYLTAPATRESRDATTLTPVVGPDHVGLAVSGRFF